MCFGYDGDAALRRSLETQGASRRSLLRGAAVAACGPATLGAVAPAYAATGAGRGPHTGAGRRSVPHRDISVQRYTLRAATATPAGVDLVLSRLAQHGYEKVELAGLCGRSATAR